MNRHRQRGCQTERQSTRKTRENGLEREQQQDPGVPWPTGGRRRGGIHRHYMDLPSHRCSVFCPSLATAG